NRETVSTGWVVAVDSWRVPDPPTAPTMSIGTDQTGTITFAIPYYRGLAYLRRAIESVFGQHSSNWRMLVVDDGSDEPAESLVKQFRDARVSYLRNAATLGMAGNWNRCLDLSQTDL